MKVVFTCNRLGIGGAERVLCNFANQMIKDGKQVSIICLDILEGFYYTIDDGVKVIELDTKYKTRKSFINRKIAGFKNLYKLFKNVKKEKPDIVISFYTRQNCYSILVCSLLNIPIIAAERDAFFLNDSKVNKILRKTFYPKATGFIHQTKWAQDYLRQNYRITCPDIVLPNPIWINKYPKRNPIPNRIIAVGRLDKNKNFQGLIRAFKKVSLIVNNTELYIYGEGVERQTLEELILELKLTNRVYLPGMTKDIVNCYAQADVFVLFSYGEGYPNVLLEALAMGVPCISADCPIGGPADMIIDGENGMLVKTGDEEELADKIINLLTNNELKNKFSHNAILIRKNNDFKYIYQQLIEYIYNCISNKRGLYDHDKNL